MKIEMAAPKGMDVRDRQLLKLTLTADPGDVDERQMLHVIAHGLGAFPSEVMAEAESILGGRDG